MLELPVTLVSVDAYRPLRATRTMYHAMSHVIFADVVLVTKFGHFDYAELPRIRTLKLLDTAKRQDFEDFMVHRLHEVFNTSHCLHLEWDAAIRNVDAWDPSWLELDYIGAPWGEHPLGRVGNLGFSLVSKKFAQAAAKLPELPLGRFADDFMCRTHRKTLESQGIRFATDEQAERFSCENALYSGQFGWHGQLTARQNNWYCFGG